MSAKLALGRTLALAALLLPGAARADGPQPTPEQQEFLDSVKAAQPAAAPITDGEAAGKLGTSRMRKANEVAARILEKRMERARPNDLLLLRRAGAADVVVVSGSYDRVQDVLRAVKVKHVVIPPHLVPRLQLMSTQTLMINCPGYLSKEGVDKVRRFVKTGGFLVTTDWALNLLAKAFPGYVSRGGKNTGNDVVKVHVHDGDEPMLKHVKTSQQSPRWWLEGSSYPIRVQDRQKVKVLISSKEMKKKYGHGAIAVSFRYDDGRVLHMTSHFYLQQARLVSAKERAKGSAFAASAGLKSDELKALKADGLDDVRTGELNSAYSMQQVTANVLVGKQKDNKELLKSYNRRSRRQVELQSGAKGGKVQGKVGKDYRLRELERKGKKVRVRDLFGREGWVDANDLL